MDSRRKTVLSSLLFAALSVPLLYWGFASPVNNKVKVRDVKRISRTAGADAVTSNHKYIGPAGGQSASFSARVAQLRNTRAGNSNIPAIYPPLEEIYHEIIKLQLRFPELIHVETIGKTTALQLPLRAVKVSDNAVNREDEPRILFMGVHHAREPIGANICLEMITSLCTGYETDSRIRRWLDELEIWFVPVVNPDGYKYIHDNDLGFPWWRKNLRDNDGDGVFNPLVDGVDLNRNYDFNWADGGDGHPGSWFYRGKKSFSENEASAIKRLAIRENFVIGISYHSYGEAVLYPWGNFAEPPDRDLILDIAQNLSLRIRRASGHGTYTILPLNGAVGQSSIWMYGFLGTIDFIVEVGTQYYPDAARVPAILAAHLNGACYLFDRILSTGVHGRVYEFYTKRPLLAEVEVVEYAAEHVKPRRTDTVFGRFHRLLLAGNYTIEIRSAGYQTKRINEVAVADGESVELDIGLFPERDVSHGSN
jgi:hypothetical protein